MVGILKRIFNTQNDSVPIPILGMERISYEGRVNIIPCQHCNGNNVRGGLKHCGERIVESGYEECFIDTMNRNLVVVGADIGQTKISYCPMCGRELDRK